MTLTVQIIALKNISIPIFFRIGKVNFTFQSATEMQYFGHRVVHFTRRTFQKRHPQEKTVRLIFFN